MTTNKSCTEKVKRLELKWTISCNCTSFSVPYFSSRDWSERACVRARGVLYCSCGGSKKNYSSAQNTSTNTLHHSLWALDENKAGWAAKTSSEGSGGKTTYYFPFHTSLGFAGCFHSTSAGRFETHRKPPATKTNCRSGKFKGFVMLFTRVACLLKP